MHAGEFKGVKGPAKTFSPVNLWNVVIPNKGATHELPFEDGHRVILFVRSGAVQVHILHF